RAHRLSAQAHVGSPWLRGPADSPVEAAGGGRRTQVPNRPSSALPASSSTSTAPCPIPCPASAAPSSICPAPSMILSPAVGGAALPGPDVPTATTQALPLPPLSDSEPPPVTLESRSKTPVPT